MTLHHGRSESLIQIDNLTRFDKAEMVGDEIETRSEVFSVSFIDITCCGLRQIVAAKHHWIMLTSVDFKSSHAKLRSSGVRIYGTAAPAFA